MPANRTFRVLIVDDEQDMRQSMSQWLSLSGFETEIYGSAEDALRACGADLPGIIISDIRMPGMDGMQLLRAVLAIDAALPVVMITGHGDVPMAVEAMRLGAYDFVEKPFDPEKMAQTAKRALAARRLTLDARALRRELADGDTLMGRFIGKSAAMLRLKEDLLDLGQSEANVLIEGETGTGKTLAAHALHAVSARAAKPFVVVNCDGRDGADLAQELWSDGQAQGGAFTRARGGTLVLESIDVLSPDIQDRLLAALASQDASAGGADPAVHSRIVSVSNATEAGAPAEDTIRPDLFYRLASARLHLPPLRSRGEDIQ
ncbi:MAG: response regulator, partial [Pseudomonadota bacterium]